MVKQEITYRVDLPNELPLNGLPLARYTSMETEKLYTTCDSPKRAVRNVVRKQTPDNRILTEAILKALETKSKGDIGIYATPMDQKSNSQKYSSDISNAVEESNEGKQLNLF